MAKMLILTGVFFIAAGLLLFLFGKIPGMGKLPGDILIKDKDGNHVFYFPIVTCIIVSLFLSLFFSLFNSK